MWLCPPQHTLHVGQDGGRSVTCMVSAGPGVWVALQGSAQVRLYHATSYEQLAEADVTPPVHKMLAGKPPKSPFPCVFPIFRSMHIASLKNALLHGASAAAKCINILSQLQGPNPMSSASAFCSPKAAAKILRMRMQLQNPMQNSVMVAKLQAGIGRSLGSCKTPGRNKTVAARFHRKK